MWFFVGKIGLLAFQYFDWDNAIFCKKKSIKENAV